MQIQKFKQTEIGEKRKFYIYSHNSNAILSPQYDLSRGNAGHPFYANSGGFI